jgi:hypothetical protein
MVSIFNVEELSKQLLTHLNQEMKEAAEPILKKALVDIENIMREKMAQRCISIIQNDFSIERMGNDIRIMVKQADTREI